MLLHSIQWSDGALADQFVLLLSHRLSATTAQPYTSKLRKFVQFCTQQVVPCLPASESTVYEYLAFLAVEGRVHPNNWDQYVAVVNTMHKDLGFPTPWMATGLCKSFISSAAKLVPATATEHPARKPLLAEHVLLFLSQALISEDLAFVRAAAAVAVAFLTFVRGGSLLMPLRKCDVTVSLVGLEVSVWDEQNTKGSGMARQISIDISLCPLVGQVVLRFTHLQQAAWAGQSYLGFFQLPRGEPFPLAEGMLSHQCATQCVTTTGGPGRGLWLCLEGPLVPLWGG